jgi:hypothetical protein
MHDVEQKRFVVVAGHIHAHLELHRFALIAEPNDLR